LKKQLFINVLFEDIEKVANHVYIPTLGILLNNFDFII